MDQWRKKSIREEKSRSGTVSPSFSSTLLDSIYRSFDESDPHHHHHQNNRITEEEEEAMKMKQSTTNRNRGGGFNNNSINRRVMTKEEEEKERVKAEITRERRACLIDKWMTEKKLVTEKSVRRKSVPVFSDNFDRKLGVNDHRSSSSMLFHSTSSSSDSSSGGGFSSSEAESVYGSRTITETRSRSSSVPTQRPKPIRTSSVSSRPERYMKTEVYDHHNERNTPQKTKSKNENGVFRTKSKAKKIYNDLMKVKQPISPGGKLASFINSLFTPKKSSSSKISTSSIGKGGGDGDGGGEEEFVKLKRKSKSAQTSQCSTASSLSRSCLSKAPSSNNVRLSNAGIKRSVRFYPVSVIVDEDSRPCGQKSLLHEDAHQPNRMSLHQERLNKQQEKINHPTSSRVEEVALDMLIKNYHRRNSSKVRDFDDHQNQDQEEDDDGAMSCASSDLFDLDNFATIGIDNRYSEELPVYETTHFETNRAIAKGFIL